MLTLLLVRPATARAQELPAPAQDIPAAAPTRAANGIPGLGPLAPRLAFAGADAIGQRLALFAPTPDEIRLSRGAKTAIIVTAIVVGALIVVGLVAVSRPGHL